MAPPGDLRSRWFLWYSLTLRGICMHLHDLEYSEYMVYIPGNHRGRHTLIIPLSCRSGVRLLPPGGPLHRVHAPLGDSHTYLHLHRVSPASGPTSSGTESSQAPRPCTWLLRSLWAASRAPQWGPSSRISACRLCIPRIHSCSGQSVQTGLSAEIAFTLCKIPELRAPEVPRSMNNR